MPVQIKALFTLLLVAVVAGCTVPDETQRASGEIFDPYERANRGVHAFNRGLDKMFFRPASKGYTAVFPNLVEEGVSNFSDNFGMPGNTVNYLLQADLENASHSFARFMINSTIGILGLADVATAMGVPQAETDFGATLHAWGAQEGAYLELPLLGPSTERDAIGKLVDLVTNPLSHALDSPAKEYGTYASALGRLSKRRRFSDTIDSVLYESADSYAQARLIYLQSRRFELERKDDGAYVGADSVPYSDPYSDPYEDIYAE